MQPAGGGRAERAWCLYDWGNSAFAAVCMTAVLPPYLAGLVNRELGSPAGTAMRSQETAFSPAPFQPTYRPTADSCATA